MVKNCCVKGCGSESYSGCNISFHCFPKSNELRDKWEKFLQVNITKNSVVCCHHFKSEDFVFKNSRNTLKPNAVPSILPIAEEKKPIVFSNIHPSALPKSTLNIEIDESPATILCGANRKVVAVQTVGSSHLAEESLRRKVKILSQRLKRRDLKIKRLKRILAFIKKKCGNGDML